MALASAFSRVSGPGTAAAAAGGEGEGAAASLAVPPSGLYLPPVAELRSPGASLSPLPLQEVTKLSRPSAPNSAPSQPLPPGSACP